MTEGFFRVAACAPAVTVADPAANADSVLQLMARAAESGARVAVFPELCVTAYTCADLFQQQCLLDAAGHALARIIAAMPASLPLAVIGMPVPVGGALYNCAVFVAPGRVVGVVPKTYIPGYGEFYEKRWFAPAPQPACEADVYAYHDIYSWCNVPFGQGLTVEVDGVTVGAEICEDLWAPVPPSTRLALGGAEVVVNLSASDDVAGKYKYLMRLLRQQSARCLCGYVYASAGYGESTTDLVFDAKLAVAESGHIVAQNTRWQLGPQITVADIDIVALRHDRLRNTTFTDCAARTGAVTRRAAVLGTDAPAPATGALFAPLRAIDRLPFVPLDSDEELRNHCEEVIHIQTMGLCRRLSATSCRSLVIGISGGLDSTLALLVAVRAFDTLGLPRTGITGISMPGFGTSGRTRSNAMSLMEIMGVTHREISIARAVEQHFADIGHDPAVHDVTYENSQARERTQILMDVANQNGGMVLGTGDLSELALGWATYNGDHMSMYGVNADVPKTLVRYLVRHFATCDPACAAARDVLLDVVDTPVSPELLPADAQGRIAQRTEDLVGPYELHDFFLFYMLRFGMSPRRIFMLARCAWQDVYSDDVIRHWLRTMVRRFFSQQFKRSCLPDGPKVGSVALSPRGDWRMPSDACAAAWLRECDSL